MLTREGVRHNVGGADSRGGQKCIPLDEAGTLPILHRVAEHEPDYFNDFAQRYPSSFLGAAAAGGGGWV